MRARRFVFPISIAGMLAAFAIVVGHYGSLGFSDNADVYDILRLGLLPGIIALIPLWLAFHRKHEWVLPRVIYCLLLFSFVTAVSLGYIFNLSWVMKPPDPPNPPIALWDWLSVGLLPFAIPIVTAFAGGEPEMGNDDGAPVRSEKVGPSPPANRLRSSSWATVIPLGTAAIYMALATVAFLTVATTPDKLPDPTPPPPPNPTATRPVSQQTDIQMIVIPASISWTRTEVSVTQGEHLRITAAGTISFIGNALVGPDGATDQHPNVCVLPGPYHHGALIGRIDNGPPFLVGRTYDETIGQTGQLDLGINDIGVDNNNGEYAAIIQLN